MNEKPILGVLLGDATGVGPELVAKLAARNFYKDYCRPVIIGDMRVLEQGIALAGGPVACDVISNVEEADWEKGLPVLDQKDQDPEQIQIATVSTYCGAADKAMIETACQLCKDGKLDGFVFAPFNKAALHAGGCEYESEHHLMAHIFGLTEPFGEINVLGNLSATRTTSHIPISQVSDHLTIETIVQAERLAHNTIKSSGIEHPKLGIAALNPHCGEGGRCGREEIDVIIPAIQKAKELGIDAEGPYSADILFIKAFEGEFDGVVTMYHDQGQIALKLKGFDQGITIAGGQPYPIVTCAHGTAYDITGKGIASTSAFENAVKMASKMATHQKSLLNLK